MAVRSKKSVKPTPVKKKKHRLLKTAFVIVAILIAIAIFAPDVEIRSIELEQINGSMDINTDQTTDLIVSPDGAEINDLDFISSNPDIITAAAETNQITISSHGEGTATLYAKAPNDIKSNEIKITVVDKEKQRKEEQAKKEKALEESREKEAQKASREDERNAQQEAKEAQVYVSKTGSKYHSNPNCSNMNNPSQVPMSRAKQMGLTPCQKCY